ncbi:MAG: thioredoxin family protein [Elusimicrobia bacterium]|nr:thioredoxin family protein [Elusimicrobiota bacterium]
MAIQIGNKAPDFDLTGVDGKKCSLKNFADKPALAVIFSCNHCPYVIAYEDRMAAIQKEFGSKGLQVVTINSNEDQNYPEDSFDNMKKRAKEKNFPFPYLRDETQAVAKAYGAAKTPHVFLFDKNRALVYAGTIDDNWEHPEKVKLRYLALAIEAVLSGRPPNPKETFPVGCSIKWRKN